MKKKSSDLLPKPLDIVGDDSDEKPKKKAAKKPKIAANTEGLTEEQAQKLRMMAVIHKMIT